MRALLLALPLLLTACGQYGPLRLPTAEDAQAAADHKKAKKAEPAPATEDSRDPTGNRTSEGAADPSQSPTAK